MKGDSRRRSVRVLVGIVVISSLIALTAPPAGAGNGIRTFYWNYSNIQLSTSQHTVSNATGFWQAVMSASQCGLLVDGLFGPATHSATITQQALIGQTQDGIVGANTFYNTQTYKYQRPDGLHPALGSMGYIDAYATEYFGYYTGQGFEVSLGWNPFSAQWLFDPQLNSGVPTYIIPAYSYRTMGSYLPWPCP